MAKLFRAPLLALLFLSFEAISTGTLAATLAVEQIQNILARATAMFPITQTSADGRDVLPSANPVLLKLDNLLMNKVDMPIPAKNTYKSGAITPTGFEGFLGKLPTSNASATAAPVLRRFSKGESIWVTKIDVHSDALVINFISDPIMGQRYHATLTFLIAKDASSPSEDIVNQLTEVITPSAVDHASLVAQNSTEARSVSPQPQASVERSSANWDILDIKLGASETETLAHLIHVYPKGVHGGIDKDFLINGRQFPSIHYGLAFAAGNDHINGVQGARELDGQSERVEITLTLPKDLDSKAPRQQVVKVYRIHQYAAGGSIKNSPTMAAVQKSIFDKYGPPTIEQKGGLDGHVSLIQWYWQSGAMSSGKTMLDMAKNGCQRQLDDADDVMTPSIPPDGAIMLGHGCGRVMQYRISIVEDTFVTVIEARMVDTDAYAASLNDYRQALLKWNTSNRDRDKKTHEEIKPVL